MRESARGELFILSAPSGAGKTTLIRAAMAGPLARAGGIAFAISHTTRRARPGEIEGSDYHFVPVEAFQRMVEEGLFLEWAYVHGNRYGTSRQAVEPWLEQGVDIVCDLDVQGAEALMAKYPQAHSIFVLPPSFRDLERRLRGRRSDSPPDIARRLAVSLREIRKFDRYDYVIINDEAERAMEALASIILEKRARRARASDRVGAILADFERALAGTENP
jgi:guanylate kinase